MNTREKNNNDDSQWGSGGSLMDDPRTSPYSGIGDLGIFNVIVIVAYYGAMILLPIAFVVAMIGSVIGDASNQSNGSMTKPDSAGSTLEKTKPAGNLRYKSVVIFDNMKIDVPEEAEKIETDEGICYATSEGSVRVLVVKIPDPEDAYPENIIDYCSSHDINLQCLVDPEGETDFYAQSRETNETGSEVFVDEDYNTYYGGNAYRIRVESETDDDSISSHIFGSLARQ